MARCCRLVVLSRLFWVRIDYMRPMTYTKPAQRVFLSPPIRKQVVCSQRRIVLGKLTLFMFIRL